MSLLAFVRDDLKAPTGRFNVVRFNKLDEAVQMKNFPSYAKAIGFARGKANFYRAKVRVYDDRGHPVYTTIQF